MKTARTTGAVAMAAFEAFVLAEILWYYLHDGEQTLHGSVSEYLHGLKQRIARRAKINDTLNMIRDLPEK